MSAGERLEQYLTEVRQRLRAAVLARASAVIALTALVVTLLAVWVLRDPGFPPNAVLIARIALAASLLVAASAMLWRPLNALRARNRSRLFERHLPAQGGRIETYLELARRRKQGLDAPLIDLLAEDAMAVAEQSPVREHLPARRVLVPAAIGGVAILALAVLLGFSNSDWGFGGRHLWFGTTIPRAQLALRGIKVAPGDATVRRNQDVPIHASLQGFKADNAEVFVRYGDAAKWERAPMRAGADGAFEFTLYALREPLSYYVASNGAKSAEHHIGVVDVPRVERMRLTYNYPSWTGLPPETDEESPDIRAVAGTKVNVEVQTSAPLNSPTLLVNGASSALKGDGAWTRGTIELAKAGHYRISARVGDEVVPLTDEHDITLVEDQKPTIEVARPGRDWQASSIEEVPVRVHAKDDFRIQNIELHYSVNGGEFKVVPLNARGKEVNDDTVLRLEEMGELQPPASNHGTTGDTRSGGAGASDSSEPLLTPGDLVTYYAVAKDRRQSVQTDLFLIHVQPFDRRFTQGQAGGSQGGGGGDDEQNAISQRQREILLATWNLQRARSGAQGRETERLDDNAHMLAELQGTLGEQARTLIERAQARGVDSADPKNRELIQNLEQAAQAMQPAAKHLNDIDLPQAIPSEQKALQHLLRAEALYTDIQVQFRNANGGGGGGGQAGRDLAEMFELEMDLDKNQYETESRAAKNDSPEKLADAIRKLRELAQRQEQLAREAARQQQVAREAERWKQEQLKRETEDLRKQLADLQRQNADAQSSQNQGNGQDENQGESQSASNGQGQSRGGRQGQSGSQGDSRGQSDGQSEGQSGGRRDQQDRQARQAAANSARDALNQIEKALANMQNASGDPNDPNDPNSAARQRDSSSSGARSAQQASHDLKDALEKMEQGRREGMAGSFDDLAARAKQLVDEQHRGQSELLSAFSRGPVPNAPGNDSSGANGARQRGLSWDRAQALSDQKRSIRNELESLQRDMQASMQQHREDAPQAASHLGEAAKAVSDSDLAAGLARSAMELERGRALQAAGRERLITDALESLENDLGQAAQLAANEAREHRDDNNSATPEELLAELSELRRAWQLAQAGQRGQPGDTRNARSANGQRDANGQNANGDQQGNSASSQGGQRGSSRAGGDASSDSGSGSAAEGAAGGANNAGGYWGGNWNGNRGGYSPGFIGDHRGRLNAWNPPLGSNAPRPMDPADFQRQADEIAKRLRSLLARMPKGSLPTADLSTLRELTKQLRLRSGGDPMESEYAHMMGLVDQLELAALDASEKNRASATTRAANPTADAPEYRETVAEYYRRLGGAK